MLQFGPYKIFGHVPGEPFKGTLFRLPLRTQEQANSSRLSPNAYTADKVCEDLFGAFAADSSAMILFLKNVECVELLCWEPTEV